MSGKVLFIKPVDSICVDRRSAILMWLYGKAFKNISGNEILSMRSVDELRDKYSRICIQYDKGTLEV